MISSASFQPVSPKFNSSSEYVPSCNPPSPGVSAASSEPHAHNNKADDNVSPANIFFTIKSPLVNFFYVLILTKIMDLANHIHHSLD